MTKSRCVCVRKRSQSVRKRSPQGSGFPGRANSHRDRGGGPGRETQNCRHFWTRVGSSRLRSANSHRDKEVLVVKCRTVVTFGLAFGQSSSQVPTVTRIGGSWS